MAAVTEQTENTKQNLRLTRQPPKKEKKKGMTEEDNRNCNQEAGDRKGRTQNTPFNEQD